MLCCMIVASMDSVTSIRLCECMINIEWSKTRDFFVFLYFRLDTSTIRAQHRVH